MEAHTCFSSKIDIFVVVPFFLQNRDEVTIY